MIHRVIKWNGHIWIMPTVEEANAFKAYWKL